MFLKRFQKHKTLVNADAKSNYIKLKWYNMKAKYFAQVFNYTDERETCSIIYYHESQWFTLIHDCKSLLMNPYLSASAPSVIYND